jgi:DNA-binding NarL/FixJ family response regulator
VRVVIGEDQALMREGLALLLGRGGFQVLDTATDADELVDRALAHRPDLVVVDIRMPPSHTDDGLRAARRIRASAPQIAILVLSQYVQPRYAAELLEDGACGIGYLLKERVARVETFCADARRVCAGGSALDPEVVSAMLARKRGWEEIERLTPRQLEVLAMMAEGRSNAAIARALTVTEKAVVKHVSHIYSQLGIGEHDDDHRRVLAVVRYLIAEQPATGAWSASLSGRR